MAPPGSGKTLLGLEFARRLGKPALVLAPNSAIQVQWQRQAAGMEDLTVLTYQAICRLDDPGTVLGDLAEQRWRADTGLGEVTGAAAERKAKDLARITASLKREIARGEHPADLADLIAPEARHRLDLLAEHGLGTVVLDECHHLASLWGYVVRAALAELDWGVHVIGLTATAPDQLTAEESELYEELLGDVDFTVPTPAVVRDGYLAPFQELAFFTRPLDSEARWLAEHDTRFQELVTSLHDDPPKRGGTTNVDPADATRPTSFPEWVITRMRHRGREGDAGDDGAEVPWSTFAKRSPRLARAGVRFLASAGLERPKGSPRGEAYERQPDLEDWLVLLEDYAQRSLRADPSLEAAARLDAIAAALRDLGFQLTRQGIRRGASDVDRLLTNSQAKSIGLVEVLSCEQEARGDGLRALVLCDAEMATRRADSELASVLDPAAGTAPSAVAALAADLRTAPLRPLLVSGRGLRCSQDDADVLAALLGATAVTEGALVRLEQPGGPRAWVRSATEALTAGHVQTLVGTRALLGEGWDAPAVNCVVDLTAAATGVAVTQMRGRSLRLDPADPVKIASNWDVVCVAPELARGTADYERFVRKHRHLYAPCEDGTIEAGPGHVHPELGPYGPPPDERFAAINRAMAARAAGHGAARERWRIGEPYEGAERKALVARSRRPLREGEEEREPEAIRSSPPSYSLLARLFRRKRLFPAAAPLDLVAQALAQAYRHLDELPASAHVEVEPRASGYLRCFLEGASADQASLFAAGLDELLSPVESPRYVISRHVAVPKRASAWHAVPEDLGRRKERAEVFEFAWQQWLGPAELVFTQRSDSGRDALAEALAQDGEWDLQLREVWV